MSDNTEFELRDFMYLDTVKLHSFASVIQGGLATLVSERIKSLGELSGNIKLGFLQVEANAGGSRSKERKHEQSMQITDAVLFDGFYQAIKGKRLTNLTDRDIIRRNKLEVNQFVQVKGIAQPPILENWTTKLNQMSTMLQTYGEMASATAKQQGKGAGQQAVAGMNPNSIKQFLAVTQLLTEYLQMTRIDPGKEYIRTESIDGGYHIWCGLLPEYVLAPWADFTSQVTIVGQLEKLVEEDKPWKLVDLSKFGGAIAADSLLSAVNSLPLGVKPIEEQDLTAHHPDIFIRPLAIFR